MSKKEFISLVTAANWGQETVYKPSKKEIFWWIAMAVLLVVFGALAETGGVQ